jgi:hypothetical protein
VGILLERDLEHLNGTFVLSGSQSRPGQGEVINAAGRGDCGVRGRRSQEKRQENEAGDAGSAGGYGAGEKAMG